MKYFLLILISAMVFSANAQTTPLKLADFKFEGIFGTTVKDDKAMYCVLGTGFFRTVRSKNADSLTDAWFKSHPSAIVIPVSSFGPVDEKDKDSKMVYCWVVDGKDTLNNYLIQNGCYPVGTMFRPKTWDEMDKIEKDIWMVDPKVNVLIDKKSYDAFIVQIQIAGDFAFDYNQGIWAEGYRQ